MILRTVQYVQSQGEQAEVVLRLKQMKNPFFQFLFQDNPLHKYYRYLQKNQQLIDSWMDLAEIQKAMEGQQQEKREDVKDKDKDKDKDTEAENGEEAQTESEQKEKGKEKDESQAMIEKKKKQLRLQKAKMMMSMLANK